MPSFLVSLPTDALPQFRQKLNHTKSQFGLALEATGHEIEGSESTNQATLFPGSFI